MDGKMLAKVGGAIGAIYFALSMWGSDIAEAFPIVSDICEKIGLSSCISAEALQEDEVLIEDEVVEI